MRLGDIKAEAIKLIGVNNGMPVSYLDIPGLERKATYAAYLVNMNGAINRGIDRMIVKGVLKDQTYVTSDTKPADELALDDVLARMLPYFIKSEVQAMDEPDAAANARNMFEVLLEDYAQNTNPCAVETVYGGGLCG